MWEIIHQFKKKKKKKKIHGEIKPYGEKKSHIEWIMWREKKRYNQVEIKESSENKQNMTGNHVK